MKEAQEKFLEVAYPIMKKKGREDLIEHPEKKAIDLKFNRCIERAIKNGKNIQQIELARLNYIKE